MAEKPHQFQMAYMAEQDRMLLRFNTQDKAEYRLWLTRRVVRVLWNALIKMVEARPAKDTPVEADKREAILQFDHETAVEQADFETPFNETAGSFPLGEEGALVATMKVGKKPDGTYSLNLSPRQGNGITISFNDRLMHSFLQLLIASSRSAEWDLELKLPVSKSTSSVDAPPPDKILRH